MAERSNPLVIPQFEGINNLAKLETGLASNVLRELDDADLTKEGKIVTRAGYTAPIVDCELGDSLWSDDHLSFALFVDNGRLFALNSDESVEEIAAGLSIGLPVSYALVNNDVFWSNGSESGMVTQMMEPADWSAPDPGGQPDLEAIDGSMGAGQVQVCVTFVDPAGRESGASTAVAIDAPGGGVRLSNIPQPPGPGYRILVYATGGDDRALYLAKTLTAGAAMTEINERPAGRVIRTQFLRRMPAGHYVRLWNGRQLVARGRFVLWSPGLRYGLTEFGKAHVGFKDRIDMLEPVAGDGGGVYVASGPRVHWLSGADPAQWVPSVAHAYGAVPGTAIQMPAEAWGLESKRMVPAWLSTSGQFCVGMPGGQVVTMKQGEAAAGIGESGASLFREADGLMQFITALRGHSTPRMAVADVAVATVYREDGQRVR